MGLGATASASLPGYAAAREGLAHRIRPAAVLDVTGDDRIAFLQGQLTQEMRELAPGVALPVAGLTPKGKLLFVARAVGLADRVRFLAPAVLRGPMLDHLRKYVLGSRVAIEDLSADFVRVGLYGPEAGRFAAPEGIDRLAGEGEFSAELVLPVSGVAAAESTLTAAGSEPVGDAAAEVLRVEAGRPRFGVDMDGSNLPDEADLGDAISTTKGCYVGQEVVARLRTYGRVNRRIVGFRFPDGGIPAGTVLRRSDESEPSRTEAGRVTSAVESPVFGAIGLGYAFRDVPEGATLVVAEPPSDPGARAFVSSLPFA